MIYDMPPILHGTPEEQLAQIRAYLVRLVFELNEGGQNDSSTNR